MAEMNFSLVNLGDWGKPANTLVEKIFDAIGGGFKPFQTRRVAKAEADAAVTKAKGEIEVTDLHRRAINRFFEEEAQRQKNIEDITVKALPQLKEDAQPEKMESDWITNLFDKCRIISDAEMQELWARVLAGEANAPGSYSKRTVNALSDFDMEDAEMFFNLCRFVCDFAFAVPILINVKDNIYTTNGVSFQVASHLDAIGVIQFGVATYSLLDLPKEVGVSYFGTPFNLIFDNDSGNTFKFGKAKFTTVGSELATICQCEPIEGFLDYVKGKWSKYLPKSTTVQSDGAAEEST